MPPPAVRAVIRAARVTSRCDGDTDAEAVDRVCADLATAGYAIVPDLQAQEPDTAPPAPPVGESRRPTPNVCHTTAQESQ